MESQLAALGIEVKLNHKAPAPSAFHLPATGRIEALDLARGMAVLLMILSHGVKGLLTFEQMPDWGLVPIHLITKFSSSLFVIVFGMALATAYLPHVETEEWPRKRKKLMIRGLVVLFWYKALTIIEMSHLYNREDIINALLYKAFPVYVEILGFYGIALLWIPWVLPFWKAAHPALRFATPAILLGLGVVLTRHFDFFGSEIFQALLVEHPNHYAWGQLARAPLFFAGMLLGTMLLSERARQIPAKTSFLVILGLSLALFGGFYVLAQDSLSEHFLQIAKNEGKHPPELIFMLFSLGGAMGLLGLSLLGGNRVARWLAPVTLLGKNSLKAFIVHIIILFCGYRFLFGYFHNVEYSFALFLGLLLIAMTSGWIALTKWVKANE